jgi:U32 family peptidase
MAPIQQYPLNVITISRLFSLFFLHRYPFISSLSTSSSSSHSFRDALSKLSSDRRKSPALWRLLNYEESSIILSKEDSNHDHTISSKNLKRKKPEIMSPAGGWPQLRAAVANGADAIYLGLTAFSARARAINFSLEELEQAVAYCHRYHVHVYVALNTLVFDTELEEVSLLIQRCAKAHVDALIVQDLGVCRLIREVAPNISIHSSTQQSITDADGVDFSFLQHGATRVVLGRELSGAEIQHVASHRMHEDVELEVFVHGALCVSYSGQCFSSEAWGGRSANRGQCAQACRLPYGLIQNGNFRDIQDMKYLLSPQDLSGIQQVPMLIQAGVSCLKIEGRLKDAQYVAATTRAYRNAVDLAWKTITGEDCTSKSLEPSDVSAIELTQLFSRGQDEEHLGLTPGFFEGTKHQRLVRGRSPRHRGVHIGRVLDGSSPKNGILVQVDSQWNHDETILKLGDGIVIDRGLPEEEELGGPLFSVESLQKGIYRITLSRDAIKKWKIFEGKRRSEQSTLVPTNSHVWKTHDALVEKKFRRLSEAEPPKLIVQVKVVGSIGMPLKVIITDGKHTVSAVTEGVLQQAEGSGLVSDKIKKAIGTKPFKGEWAIAASDIDLSELDNAAWCPVSWIKEARRQAVESWEELHLSQRTPTEDVNDERKVGLLYDAPSRLLQTTLKRLESENNGKDIERSSGLSVLCRNYEQVDVVCRMIETNGDTNLVDEVIIDFLELEGMTEAMSRIRSVSFPVKAVVASPRILKPEEGGIWKSLLSLEPDALLIRSAGLLYRLRTLMKQDTKVNVGVNGNEQWVRIPALHGDFSLNAANALTVSEFLSFGLERVTASYDLNANSITRMGVLLQQQGGNLASCLEVVVHCKMPIFHTEHCVFARFLTRGNSYVDCGHACTRNTLHLRDERGMDNLVLADMGCRNTVFAAQAQSGVHSLKQWQSLAGIRRFRVELVDERPEDASIVVQAYVDCLKGNIKANDVWEILQEITDSNGRRSGVSLGSFRNNQERRAGELS